MRGGASEGRKEDSGEAQSLEGAGEDGRPEPDPPPPPAPADHQHLVQVLLEGVDVAAGLLQVVQDTVQHELVIQLHQEAALQHLFALSHQLEDSGEQRCRQGRAPAPAESSNLRKRALPLRALKHFPGSSSGHSHR